MNFKEQLSDNVLEIEKILDEYLPESADYQSIIMDAMKYSVKAGGKRIRPLLMHEAYNIFGGEGDVIKPFMAAIEMLHTYSLVHDDLPAMDNDEYRRGRKTTHVVYGEAVGILAGDALLNYSFETASKAFDMTDDFEMYKRISKALRIFMTKAGIYGMIGGQTVDVCNEGRPVTREMLDFIFRLKTAALLEASLMVGAILAGASDDDVLKIEQIGNKVGMAFQIQDDILDVIGDTKVLGKPVLSDEKNNKVTYVTLYGLNQARADVVRYSDEAIALIEELKQSDRINNSEFFEGIVRMLINRDK
ncbi:MAG: polyprenyl synthetase family protein [Lachnospiraceae bacterium]